MDFSEQLVRQEVGQNFIPKYTKIPTNNQIYITPPLQIENFSNDHLENNNSDSNGKILILEIAS